MIECLTYKEITLDHLDELAKMYIETFNAEPWNDEWTVDTAGKRLHQMINTEDFYGVCAYQNDVLASSDRILQKASLHI